MQFSINIYEKGNPNVVTMFEHAAKSSLNLSWANGSEKVRTLIGSDLQFTMEVTDFQDAYFEHLNTQDERQFNVTLVNEETAQVIWSGHLLPDLYDEPYTQGAFFVNFVASCGLGSLKGQYLPNDFYVAEKTMASIVAECLRLTGLELDIYIAPAITNRINKRWDQLYLDTSKYTDDNKKLDAYEILDQLMASSLCALFQTNGAWYVYGLNKFNLFTILFNVYDVNGTYLRPDEVLKDPKNPMYLGETRPRIGVNTPRKTVSATYPIEQDLVPKSAYDVENDGYVLNTEIDTIAHDWVYTTDNFSPKYNTANGKVFLAPLTPSYDPTRAITLRKEILFTQGNRVNWSVKLKATYSGTEDYLRSVEELVVDGDWDNVVRYDIFYTEPETGSEVLLYSNENGGASSDERYQLNFNTDRDAELNIKMIAPASAYYNIRLYQPVGIPANIKIDKVLLQEVQVFTIAPENEQTYTNEIKQLYTQSESVTLTAHDDIRDLRNFIRLTPLNVPGNSYKTELIGNLQVLNTEDANYIVLPFSTLKLALEHQESLSVSGQNLVVLGFVYNYLDGDEFLLQYDADNYGSIIENGADLTVDQRRFITLPDNIGEWTAYTDDFYGITYKRYGEIVADVLRNLYQKAHPTLTVECRGFISFLDMISFNYNGDKIWYPLSVSWLLDLNRSALICSQNFYGEAVTENLPPVVDAGLDQYLNDDENTASLLATATDPDGTIVAVLWEVVTGTGVTFTDATNLATDVSGLTGDYYEFRVTVTDDVGLTASDTMIISRLQDYEVLLTLEFESLTEEPFEEKRVQTYFMRIDPPLAQGQTVRYTVNSILITETPVAIGGLKPTVVFSIGKNVVFNGVPTAESVAAYFDSGTYETLFLQRRDEVHRLRLTAGAYNLSSVSNVPANQGHEGKVFAKIQVDITAEIVTGANAVIGNIPLQLNLEARK